MFTAFSFSLDDLKPILVAEASKLMKHPISLDRLIDIAVDFNPETNEAIGVSIEFEPIRDDE